MGVRRWISQLVARREPSESDPNKLTEVACVPLHEGPMLVTRLEREGVKAVGIEAFDVVTNTLGRMRIIVRRSDVRMARRILERLR